MIVNGWAGNVALVAPPPARPLVTASLELADGRLLEFFDAGPQDGELLIMNHGTPGSGMIYQGWADRCASHGIRLASYSRPG
jgi:hypothetical protein